MAVDDFEVTVDGEKIVGPVTLDQVRRGIEAWKLPPDVRLRRVGETTWRTAPEVLARASPKTEVGPASLSATAKTADRYMIHTPGSTAPPVGPFGVGVIKAMLDEGSILEGATACKVGESTWVPVAEILGAAGQVRGATPVAEEPEALDCEVLIDEAPSASEVAAPTVPETTASPKSPTSDFWTRATVFLWIALGLVPLVGFVIAVALAWQDKAEPDFAKCVQAEAKGDILGAETACNEAVTHDPNSKSGKAATAKLNEMKSAIAKAKAEKDATDAQAAAEKAAKDAEEARARAAASEAAMRDLRRRVSRSRSPSGDGGCAGMGKPPHGY